MQRHGLKILIAIMNDGGYGAEVLTLRADGIDESDAIHGRGDLRRVARDFGLDGAVVTDLADLPRRFAEFGAADRAAIWNIHVSDVVTSPIRRKGQSHH